MSVLPRSFRIAGLVAAGALCLGAALPAAATKTPLVLSPTFTENESAVTVALAKGAPVCTVNFTELKDARRDKTVIGNLINRSMQSPPDTQAWMRSILSGLARRGIKPQFDVPPAADATPADASAPEATAAEPAATPAIPTARLGLQMVWLTGVSVTITGNVVVTIDATGPGGKTLSQTYRGRTSKMDWAGTGTEMEKAINDAFSDALNQMAPDLAKLCSSN